MACKASNRRGRGRHIVFVSLVFPPDSSASSILFNDLFSRLAANLRVTVLCGFPSKDADVDLSTLPRHDWLGEVEIVRCGFRLPGKRSLALRALAYSSFLLDAGRHLPRFGRETTVVGGTDPPFAPAVLGLLSRLCRWRYEQVLLDLYPDGFVAMGSLGERAPITRLWRALNRHAFSRARRIVVIGRDMAERLQREYGVPGGRIAYIPLWGVADVDRLARRYAEDAPPESSVDGSLVIQYSGNMGLWHDLDTIVRAAALLREEKHIRFVFIGNGLRRAGAERLARELALPNAAWLDFLPPERLARSLAECDAALISLRAGLSGTAAPSKLYGILASGRAVIAQVPADSEVARTVREERCGVVVTPGDAAALAGAIRTLSLDREAVRRMGQRARQAYLEKYTLAAAVRRFLALWA